MPNEYTTLVIAASMINAGDEWWDKDGVHHWTAIEDAEWENDEARVRVRYTPDGGSGVRAWMAREEITIRRPHHAAR